MDLEEYKRRYPRPEEAAPGWDAISRRLGPIYPGQEPLHCAPVISSLLGGPDPLDGISAYQCRDGGIDHLHFCTFGYTMLYYEEEAVGDDFSNFGFEMTFRLASKLPSAEQPMWAFNMLQNIARYVFESGKRFREYQWISSGPIRLEYETDIVGLAFLPDPVVAPIDSPHGRVEFIQAFGLTRSELDVLKSGSRRCEEIIAQHREINPLLVTDLVRKDG
ncbi:MAG TPA: suppressor of fused domain protein [Hyphomonadaceae bacterium]|jgi:hypothetical protein|nr:suppressor of fused domain protein [Hyphomonadaceae bacterium]